MLKAGTEAREKAAVAAVAAVAAAAPFTKMSHQNSQATP